MNPKPIRLPSLALPLLLTGLLPWLSLGGPGDVFSLSKIADGVGGLNGGTLTNDDHFGASCTVLGDLDGNGVPDLAVGAWGDNTGGNDRGAVHVLFLNANGTIRANTKIADNTGGLPMDSLDDFDRFGWSVTNLGDLDGDGVPDLAVGAQSDDTGTTDRGAVYVLFLNADGTVKANTKIADNTGGLPMDTLIAFDRFGWSVANLGDLDGDGVTDLAVGQWGDSTGGNDRGAVQVLFLNANGTVKANTKIADNTGGLPMDTFAFADQFGWSLANLGDLDGDGVPDLAVGADRDDTGGDDRGAVQVLFLNANGTVKTNSKIADGNPGGLPMDTLADEDFFGISLASLGDLDGDGVPDLAVGADGDDTSGDDRGAIHLLEIGDLPIEVTTHLDENNGSGNGAGRSLREAIAEAKAINEFRTIVFGPSLDGQTITLGGMELDMVDQSLKISGAGLPNGIAISGNDQSRIFDVDASSVLNVECLQLRNGASLSPPNGCAIRNLGTTTIRDSHLTENHSTGNGGAISNESGVLRVESCSFSNNSTQFVGGAIHNIGASAFARIISSTFFGNEARGGGGAAVNAASGATVSLIHVTIVGNSATSDSGGGIRAIHGASVEVRNSIVAGNMAIEPGDDISPQNGATITASGNNLIGSNESVESFFPSNTRYVGTQWNPIVPALWPLGDYGGKTPTMPPRIDYRILDAGSYFPAPESDQQGSARNENGYPDLGAVEGVYTGPDNSARKAALNRKLKKLRKNLKSAKRRKQVAKVKRFKKQIKKVQRQLRAL